MSSPDNRASKRCFIVGGILLLYGCAVSPTSTEGTPVTHSKPAQLQHYAQPKIASPVVTNEADSTLIDKLSARTDAIIAREVKDAVRLNTEDLQRVNADSDTRTTEPANN